MCCMSDDDLVMWSWLERCWRWRGSKIVREVPCPFEKGKRGGGGGGEIVMLNAPAR